jgi:hypothetical protein
MKFTFVWVGLVEFGLCTTDVLDTFKGVFIRDMGSREPAISIPIDLSNELLRLMHREIVAARFSEYPADFHVRGSIGFAPAMRYSLETRIDGTSHSVTWRDGIKPSTPDADRLRNLFMTIKSVITDHPDVSRLPQARVGCG